VFPTVNSWNYSQVKEVAAMGASVLVADRLMGAELFPAASAEKINCAPLPDAMTKRIASMLEGHRFTPNHMKVAPLPTSWVTPPAEKTTDDAACDAPLVTVCLMHFERPHLVEQALASVENQTYSHFEIVLLDDGSIKKKSLLKLKSLQKRFEKNGWRIIRQQNRYLGAARNTAAMAARGKYLYFLDDDNVLKPNALETITGVAERTGADVVASFSDVFKGNQPPDHSSTANVRIIQVGDDISYGFFRNAFGDSNALIRRSTFLMLGGNSEDYAVGLDDMEFFARAILNGYRLTVVPEALYWARQMPTRLRNLHFNPRAGRIRVCRTYLSQVPPKLRPLFLMISGRMGLFEGTDITLKKYLSSLIMRKANSGIGARLRYSIFRPILYKLLVRFGMIKN
jgi:GT2 family glycosyltransferase